MPNLDIYFYANHRTTLLELVRLEFWPARKTFLRLFWV